MKIPFARYATFCLLSGMSTEELARHIDDLSLPELNEAVLAELSEDAGRLPLPRSAVRAVQRKTPLDQVAGFLSKLGYDKLYSHHCGVQSEDWTAVWKMLENPVQRVAIECALLAGVTATELETQFSAATGTQLKASVVELFSHYFFDHAAMRKSDWREYLGLCSSHSCLHRSYLTALTRPKDEVLHSVGVPTKIQIGAMLSNIVAVANFKFQRYSAHDSPELDDQSRKWAKLAVETSLKLEKFSSSDAGDFASAIQSEFEFLDEEIPMVDPEMLKELKPPSPETVNPSEIKLHTPHQPEREV
jgi:hypothetical protein